MLKQKKIKHSLRFLLCLWLCLLSCGGKVLANELGGTVKTEGVISFYEEITTSTTDSSGVFKDKLVTRLPQTGEKLNYYWVLLGLLLVLIVLLVKKYVTEVRE